jgi:hypothetical protein
MVASVFAVIGVLNNPLLINDKRAGQHFRVARGLALHVALRRSPRPGGNDGQAKKLPKRALAQSILGISCLLIVHQAGKAGGQPAADIQGVLWFAQPHSNDAQSSLSKLFVMLL